MGIFIAMFAHSIQNPAWVKVKIMQFVMEMFRWNFTGGKLNVQIAQVQNFYVKLFELFEIQYF